ncbi:MAG: nucleotide exchange factor GrpE [Bryobacteraceae bacterium]
MSKEMEEEIRSDDTVDTSTLVNGDALAAVKAERDKLAQEKAELQDLMLRRQAEFENFRRRSERERMEFADYAGMEAVKGLLPILDDFERALTASATLEGGGEEFLKGFELIYQRLFESLKKAGLEPIETADAKFDPHVHHAIEMVQSEELEDHTILDEYQRGYNFKGRLLRPAMVRVAVRP